MAEIEENYRFPLGVTAEEGEEEGVVRACVVVKGLKKKTFSSAQPANGSVKVDFKERSLEVIVELQQGDRKTERYRYSVKQLPDTILPAECSFKVKKDQVVLSLRKAKSRSWARELSTGGLETFREPDSDSDSEQPSRRLDTVTE